MNELNKGQIEAELQNLLYAMEMDVGAPPEVTEKRVKRVQELRAKLLDDQKK